MSLIVNLSRRFATSRELLRPGAPLPKRRSYNGFQSGAKFSLAFVFLFAGGVLVPSARAEDAPPVLFPHVRALSLPEARALAMKRAPALAVSSARIAVAEADRRDVENRFKVNTAGGLDPFSGQIRFYLGLDLERLAGLNKAQKQSARQKVEAEKLGAISGQQDAMKRVSAAWYSLTTAQMAVESAARRQGTTNALSVAAKARFEGGQGDLSSVLSALNATETADDAYQQARQSVALACLELAQSCGYMTAEEMEAVL